MVTDHFVLFVIYKTYTLDLTGTRWPWDNRRMPCSTHTDMKDKTVSSSCFSLSCETYTGCQENNQNQQVDSNLTTCKENMS